MFPVERGGKGADLFAREHYQNADDKVVNDDH